MVRKCLKCGYFVHICSVIGAKHNLDGVDYMLGDKYVRDGIGVVLELKLIGCILMKLSLKRAVVYSVMLVNV